MYKILLQVTPLVQPISCDEAFLDVTGLGDPEALAAAVRGKILQATGCNASAGISHNMLLARLATKAAKPNGQYLLPKSQVICLCAVQADRKNLNLWSSQIQPLKVCNTFQALLSLPTFHV